MSLPLRARVVVRMLRWARSFLGTLEISTSPVEPLRLCFLAAKITEILALGVTTTKEWFSPVLCDGEDQAWSVIPCQGDRNYFSDRLNRRHLGVLVI